MTVYIYIRMTFVFHMKDSPYRNLDSFNENIEFGINIFEYNLSIQSYLSNQYRNPYLIDIYYSELTEINVQIVFMQIYLLIRSHLC